VWAVFALTLVLRLMDELKDVEVDRRLFASRPLPSGRVLESDIRGALAAVAVLLLAAHLAAGFWSAVVVLAYATLMFRWFFAPRHMRPRLLLTLVTHQPIVPLLLLHLTVLFAAQQGLALRDLSWAPVALALVLPWSGVLAWELSRKIRAAEDEDDYVTYSRRLGRRSAVLAAAGVQAAGVASAVALAIVGGVSWRTPAVVGLGFAVALVGHVRFLGRPSRATARLKPFAEANALLGGVGGLFA
jgi:4-hydroxybenzoate polyprenyltransferase